MTDVEIENGGSDMLRRLPSDREALDELLLCISTAFILLMQVGFALIENGSVRHKNSSSILLKNMIDVSLGGIAFWLIGFGIAFGGSEDTGGHFLGTSYKYFVSYGFEEITNVNPYTPFIFQFSFAATSATIVSGSLAERTRMPAYMVFSFLMTGTLKNQALFFGSFA